jgi:hypothetical protein
MRDCQNSLTEAHCLGHSRGCSSAGERLLCKQEVEGSNPSISMLTRQVAGSAMNPCQLGN